MRLTDADLIWQGLSPWEYEILDDKSKGFVEDRAYAFRRVKTIRLVLDVLREIGDDVGKGGGDFVRMVITGRSREGVEVVKEVLAEYAKSGGKDSVRDLYRRKYKGRILDILDKKTSSQKTLMQDHRAVGIALLLSEWEDTVPEKIIKTEADVIKKIMEIADENKDKGLTDREITLATEELVQDEFHEAQFHLEALHKDHRKELIKRALRLRGR